MDIVLLALKVIVVIFFLILFLRNNRAAWGIGLLTVTSAILLDAFLGTFGPEEMKAELGFFYYVIIGVLFAGATFFLWDLLRPLIGTSSEQDSDFDISSSTNRVQLSAANLAIDSPFATVDTQELAKKIRFQLGPDDILDLIFDMDWTENDVNAIDRDADQLTDRIIRLAEQRNQMYILSITVERILSPFSNHTIPRKEKLSINTPRPALRHYLLATNTTDSLKDIVDQLGIDWKLLAGNSKKSKTRDLLTYLIRRDSLEELIVHIKTH